MEFDPLGYYKILDVDGHADETKLKLNFREKAKFWHPDHNKAKNALEEFQKISLAYDVLSNSKSKTIYDLLALVYTAQDFPDMKTLKLYKAANGAENPFLRVFKLERVADVFKNPHLTKENLIGTYEDALKFINDITKKNWLNGWWSPKAFLFNFKALKNNYNNIGKNDFDNLKLLIHNAAAYFSEDKNDKAYLSAKQALEYANSTQKISIQNFMYTLSPATTPVPAWNYAALKKTQLKIPFFLFMIFFIGLLTVLIPFLKPMFQTSQDDYKITYYQEVRFNTGGETVDDMVVSKIFNIPVDSSDEKMLYHISSAVDIMHGPSEQFDVLQKAVKNQTVRITGYTPDQEWYRVMLDNGEMGFIKKSYLKQGIGLTIPEGSKIFSPTEETR